MAKEPVSADVLLIEENQRLQAELEVARADLEALHDHIAEKARAEARKLSSLGRAKIVNALRSLPLGYAFHSDEPALRCIAWAEGFDPALHNAAVEVISSIGQHHPDMIGGSGWLGEGNSRMRLVAGVEVVGGRGALGMSPDQLAASLVDDKTKRAAKIAADVAEQAAADKAAGIAKEAGIAEAFAPAPAPSLGGSGVVKEEEEEDMSGEG